jgi:hypothetical protein
LVTVTSAKAGTKPATAVKVAAVADKSEASKTTVEGECPSMGASWIELQPIAYTHTVMAAAADVRKANTNFKAGLEGAYAKPQWCYKAVAAKGAKTTCVFDTASKAKYTAALYCETIEGWFFASATPVNVTAPDNGGKPVTLSLTFKKEIDVVKNNDVVLKVCGKLAESLAVPYARVTDAYGGFFGNPSPSLPAASTATKAATTTTANKTNATKRMLANATNATAAKTEWVLNLFVQPDPFSKKADNAATSTAATGTAALAAIDTVTKATYGAMTAKAAVVTEAAVKFVKKPTALGNA